MFNSQRRETQREEAHIAPVQFIHQTIWLRFWMSLFFCLGKKKKPELEPNLCPKFFLFFFFLLPPHHPSIKNLIVETKGWSGMLICQVILQLWQQPLVKPSKYFHVLNSRKSEVFLTACLTHISNKRVWETFAQTVLCIWCVYSVKIHLNYVIITIVLVLNLKVYSRCTPVATFTSFCNSSAVIKNLIF